MSAEVLAPAVQWRSSTAFGYLVLAGPSISLTHDKTDNRVHARRTERANERPKGAELANTEEATGHGRTCTHSFVHSICSMSREGLVAPKRRHTRGPVS